MPKYTIVTSTGEKIVATISKHHSAGDFMKDVLDWVGRGVTVTAVYHMVADHKGNETGTRVK